MKQESSFYKQILSWFDQYGRKNLPWQQQRTPYRIWVSEIMLQQTQVSTVIPYYQRFIASFPDIEALATAPLDAVLHHWTGLGYYARARNLHQTARQIHESYRGHFPDSVEALSNLPGIGQSTAGAICALAFNKHAVILDGNVKRVLCRYYAVIGWPEQSQTKHWLWELAKLNTPADRTADYTQAIMDLGATLCTRSRPTCQLCPLQPACQAHQTNTVGLYPEKKSTHKTKPVKALQMLMLESPDGEVLLQRRPPHGVWGGLWSFPELETDINAADFCQLKWPLKITRQHNWLKFRHTFSHFHLDISPVHLQIEVNPAMVMEPSHWVWYNIASLPDRGFAAPVKKLLQQLQSDYRGRTSQ